MRYADVAAAAVAVADDDGDDEGLYFTTVEIAVPIHRLTTRHGVVFF